MPKKLTTSHQSEKKEFRMIVWGLVSLLVLLLLLLFLAVGPYSGKGGKDKFLSEFFEQRKVSFQVPLEDGGLLQLLYDKEEKNVLRKIDPRTAEILWNKPLPNLKYSGYWSRYNAVSPYIVRGNRFIYLKREKGKPSRIFVRDLKSGEKLYSQECPGCRGNLRLLEADKNSIYVINNVPKNAFSESFVRTRINVLSLEKGRLLWDATLKGDYRGYRLSPEKIFIYDKEYHWWGNLYIYDKRNGKLKELKSQDDPIWLDKTQLYYVSKQRTLNLYNLKTEENRVLLENLKVRLRIKVLYKKRYMLISRILKGELELFDLSRGRNVWKLNLPQYILQLGGVYTGKTALLYFKPTGSAVAHNHELIKILDLEKGKLIKESKRFLPADSTSSHTEIQQKDGYYYMKTDIARKEVIAVFDPEQGRFIAATELPPGNSWSFDFDIAIRDNILYMNKSHYNFGYFTPVTSSYIGIDLLKGKVVYGDTDARAVPFLKQFLLAVGLE